MEIKLNLSSLVNYIGHKADRLNVSFKFWPSEMKSDYQMPTLIGGQSSKFKKENITNGKNEQPCCSQSDYHFKKISQFDLTMSLSSEVTNLWRGVLLECLDSSCRQNDDISPKSRIQSLLDIVSKCLKDGSPVEWSEVEKHVNHTLPVTFIRLLSFPDIPTDVEAVKIGLALILIYVGVLKVEDQELMDDLQQLSEEKQHMMVKIYKSSEFKMTHQAPPPAN